MLFKLFTILLPWGLKRAVLRGWFKYEIHPTAWIGLAWIFPKKLSMGKGSKIDHLSVAVNLDRLAIGDNVLIGRSNWITGFPGGTDSLHFQHQYERTSELVLGDCSSITKQHHIDCTSRIEIGAYSTVAGYQTQLLTHSIDLEHNRQDSKPIFIGEYTFVGTNCVVLGGASLPPHSVLGAKSLLTDQFEGEWKLYAGVPAKMIKDISKEAKYFSRKDGFVF